MSVTVQSCVDSTWRGCMYAAQPVLMRAHVCVGGARPTDLSVLTYGGGDECVHVSLERKREEMGRIREKKGTWKEAEKEMKGGSEKGKRTACSCRRRCAVWSVLLRILAKRREYTCRLLCSPYSYGSNTQRIKDNRSPHTLSCTAILKTSLCPVLVPAPPGYCTLNGLPSLEVNA